MKNPAFSGILIIWQSLFIQVLEQPVRNRQRTVDVSMRVRGTDKEAVNEGRPARPGLRILRVLTTLNPWHFLWISIVMSEVLTALMGVILKGSITYDYLVTGGVVSLIVAGIVIFLLKEMMQVRLDNEFLRAEMEQQREAAAGLSKELDFQSLLMEAIPDMLCVLNPAGRLIRWNRKTEEATGFNRDGLAGKYALDLIAEEDRDEAQAGLEEAYSGGRAVRELQVLTGGGEKVVHLFSGAAIREADGRLVGFIAIGRDISKMKKMEEEMHRVRKLESAGILAAGIAHDFNDLLTSILGNIRLAVLHVDQREILRETLLKAQKASARASELTRQLLVFSRGGFPVKRPTELGGVIREYAGFAVRGSSVDYYFDIAADLRDADVDEAQIGQAIHNVVSNAVEAMPRGGTIMISAANIHFARGEMPPLRGGSFVRISVADCGGGIPREHLLKIFDPYFTTKLHGSGLGLTIAHAIIKNHEGCIRAESEPGKGTVFQIFLPAGW